MDAWGCLGFGLAAMAGALRFLLFSTGMSAALWMFSKIACVACTRSASLHWMSMKYTPLSVDLLAVKKVHSCQAILIDQEPFTFPPAQRWPCWQQHPLTSSHCRSTLVFHESAASFSEPTSKIASYMEVIVQCLHSMFSTNMPENVVRQDEGVAWCQSDARLHQKRLSLHCNSPRWPELIGCQSFQKVSRCPKGVPPFALSLKRQPTTEPTLYQIWVHSEQVIP